MRSNTNLRSATEARNDEFYTQLKDIEQELQHYKEYFRGKVVFCNCDGPRSNFIKYFQDHFIELGLKSLLTSSYDPESGAGDFRNPDVIEMLKEADIVVTNPPFTLFREYVTQLFEYDKKFIIVGNMNICAYKEIFPLIRDNKMRMGFSPRSMNFELPDGSLKQVNACWWTNFRFHFIRPPLKMTKLYDDITYSKYDVYDAINVDFCKDIPYDYYGAMGVPITFLSKYNSEQFDILAMLNAEEAVINDKRLFRRIIIKRKDTQ